MAKATGGYIQQLPSGSFRVSVYAGSDPLTGRQIRLRKTCKAERAAQIELGKLLEQADAGRQPETGATVAELMDKYACPVSVDRRDYRREARRAVRGSGTRHRLDNGVLHVAHSYVVLGGQRVRKDTETHQER